MNATPVEAIIARVQAVYGRWRRDTPVDQMRADWDRLFAAPGQDVELRAETADGVEVLWVVPRGLAPARVLLYFHGGGYKLGSVTSHRDLMARIGAAAGCRVLGVNYRLAPEAHFPAPVDDAVAVYEWLLAAGVQPSQIAVGGDSAGGGLAAARLLSLRDRGRALPAAAVLLSAWTDLTAQGDSYKTRAEADPIHQRAMILATARQYLGRDGDASNPLASPLFGSLAGLPPLLLQVGDRETVLDDSIRFAAKARLAGVRADLEVYPNMIHVFQQFADEIPEAREAIAGIGRFLHGIWPVRSASQSC
jgi:acetyl esterase/lipase